MCVLPTRPRDKKIKIKIKEPNVIDSTYAFDFPYIIMGFLALFYIWCRWKLTCVVNGG